MAFHILHISDIHFKDVNTAGFIARGDIKKRIADLELSADCIVISGDLFHQGSLDKQAAQECKTFIGELQEKLMIGTRKPVVLAVPGNHDLDRMAREEQEDAYNVFTERSGIVNKARQSAIANEAYSLSENEKEVIYRRSFAAFRRFSGEIGSKTYNAETDSLTPESYEVRSITLGSQGFKGKIQFVCMNTAVFAGQSVQGEEFWKRRTKSEQAMQKEYSNGESVEAAKIGLRIAKEQRDYELYHAIIVDEEKSEDATYGVGLSSDGERKLSAVSVYPDEDIVCTLFVGHHGYEFLSPQTKTALNRAMMNCRFADKAIYLCGHAHQVRFTTYVHPDDQYFSINQAQAGVLFSGDGFSEYGFNYITIETGSAGDSEGAITIAAHYRMNTPSKKGKWFEEESVLNYRISASTQRDRNQEKYSNQDVENVSTCPKKPSYDSLLNISKNKNK